MEYDILDSEPVQIIEKDETLSKISLETIREELNQQIQILLKLKKDPPYLINFDDFIRRRAVYEIEKAIAQNNGIDQFLYENEKLEKQEFMQMHKMVDRNEVLRHTVNMIDKDLLVDYISQIQKRADQTIVFTENEKFDKLKIPLKLQNLLPITPEKKAMVYSLSVKWLLKVEKNSDLISRCISYRFVDEKDYGSYHNKIKEVNCPDKSSLSYGKNYIVEYCLNYVVENVCSNALNGAFSKVRKFMVSYFIYYFFGLMFMSVFGFFTSFLEIPFINAVEHSPFTNKITKWALDKLLKITRIKNEDLCAFLLRQSISAIDEINCKIEEIIDALVQSKPESEDYKIVHKTLVEQLDKLTKKRKKIEESKEEYYELVIREVEDGWIMLDDVDTVEKGSVNVDDVEFTLVDVAEDSKNILTSRDTVQFEMIKITDNQEEKLDEETNLI